MRHMLRKYVVPTFIVPFLLMGVTLSALAMAPAASSLASLARPDDGAVTTTTFLGENPPAASPTTEVTFTVGVTASGGGPAPTGTVSFTWTKTNGGGATSGPVGTGSATLDGNSQAQITGTLPAGGQNGSITITAVYSGDAFNNTSTAQIIYWVLANCSEGQWPHATNGYPDVVAGSPTGYYIGQSNGWFTVTAVNPSATSVNFIGSIKTNGLLLDVSSTKNELGDKVTLRGSTKIRFTFHDNGYLDGISFYAGCGFQVTFDLNISGAPAPKNQIFLGNPTTHAKANPLQLIRG
jgi:hypothetical protein